MRHRLLLLMLALSVGCPSTADDDDATADDDDATEDDDDATADDDDATADDDDSAGDDDDSTGDDDDSAGDDDDSAGDDDESVGDDDDSAPSTCSDRTGGAVVTIQTGGDSFTFWSTNDAFIDDCIAEVGSNGWYILLSTPTTPGDCDPQWSWTVDPQTGSLGNSPPFNPACAGTAQDVENTLATFQAANAGWCPSGGVVSVSDQR